MDPIYHYFPHIKDERYIALQPWYIAHKKRKADYARGRCLPAHDCPISSGFKLKSIDSAGRTPLEVDEWDNVVETADKQARVRAVQMHLNVITTLSALPLSAKCCENYRSPCAAAGQQGLHTDEIDRDWTYDTGAATCFICRNLLTDKERRSIFKIPAQKFATAG